MSWVINITGKKAKETTIQTRVVFWFDNVYIRAIPEHPEDLFTLYVMRVQKRKWRTFGLFSVLVLVRGQIISYRKFAADLAFEFYIIHPPGTLFLAAIF